MDAMLKAVVTCLLVSPVVTCLLVSLKAVVTCLLVSPAVWYPSGECVLELAYGEGPFSSGHLSPPGGHGHRGATESRGRGSNTRWAQFGIIHMYLLALLYLEVLGLLNLEPFCL